jgi:hypothetical protein
MWLPSKHEGLCSNPLLKKNKKHWAKWQQKHNMPKCQNLWDLIIPYCNSSTQESRDRRVVSSRPA